MKLEHTSLAIRERSQIEVFDISFLFIKQNARLLVWFYLFVGLPPALLLYFLSQFCEPWAGAMFACLLFCGVQACVTAMLGEALFAPGMRAGMIRQLAKGRKSSWGLLTHLWDVILAGSVIGTLYRAATRYFSTEVFLLENISRHARSQRMRAIHQRSYVGAMLSNLAMGTLIALSVYMSAAALTGLLVGQWTVETDPVLLVEQFSFWLGVSAGMFYCSVAHFLLYINHRTTFEGWDLYLQARRCARESDLP